MKIIANGFPKAGGHALRKGLELLGFPVALSPDDDGTFKTGVTFGHFPFGSPLPIDTKHIVIFRNPRNCLISMHRMLYPSETPYPNSITTGYLIKLIKDFYLDKNGSVSLADMLRAFLPWRETVLCIKYEDLMASDKVLRGIASYLNTPYLEDAFPNLEGLSPMWNPVKSDWRLHWHDEIEKVWKSEGLDILEKKLGYINIWNSQ